MNKPWVFNIMIVAVIVLIFGGCALWQKSYEDTSKFKNIYQIPKNIVKEKLIGKRVEDQTVNQIIEVAIWVVKGAGNSSFNGTYIETGTYQGKPYYTFGSSTRYLLWDGSGNWVLNTYLGGSAPYYQGTGTDLPANDWYTTIDIGPAPTVSVSSGWIVPFWTGPFYKYSYVFI